MLPTTDDPASDAPTEDLAAAILRLEQVCEDLERLADTLPGQVDTYAAVCLAERLLPTLRECQCLEETEVFPLLLKTHGAAPQMIARLHAEHVEDEDHAAMVEDAIIAFVRDPKRGGADKLGYALRGLFQPLRRHVAFDRGVILPSYRAALDARNGKLPDSSSF